MLDGDIDDFIDSGSRLISVAIRPEWRDAIRLHLAISLGHARNVAEFPLPDDIDPAEVFSA